MKRATVKIPPPWTLPIPPPSEVFAVKAIEAGTATPQQQAIFWKYLREVVCGARKMSYWPGGEDGRRATDFAEGKRFVAVHLERLVNLTPSGVDIHDEPPPMPRAAEPGED